MGGKVAKLWGVPHVLIGRSERIRTSGPCLPKTVLYQAELRSDRDGRNIATGGVWQERIRAFDSNIIEVFRV